MKRIATRLFILAAALVLAACEAAVNVNATANVSARYSGVLVTVKEVWFNESATAIPADTTWEKFRLDETRTIDLVDITGGELTSIASDLAIPAATYRQIRVILAGTDEDLYDSADDAGATYNNQVTWFDEDGDEQTLPLEVPNADQGIGIEIKLKAEEVAVGSGTTSTTSVVQLFFDAARDLTQFRYDGQAGFLLSSTLKAFNADDVGTIRGTLNLSQLVIDTDTGRPEIEVTAQKLDEALNRRVVAGSASVSSSGAFVLYPLRLDEDETTTTYDLVIHGPEIQTIVIRNVPVTEALPGSATSITLNGLAPQPAQSFEANVRDDAPVAPRGARIGFYQTLPGDDGPYLIEEAAVDPLSGRFAQPVVLSRAGTISSGTYGGNFTLSSGIPEQGAARYAVAALSPQYGSGVFADTLLRPASPVSDTALFSVPAIGMPVSAVPGTISTAVTVQNPGRYSSGLLMVTHEGAVVATVPLNEVLQQSLASASVDVTLVPAGTSTAALASGLYHLEAWTWNSADPDDTFTRHPGTAAIDLRAVAAATGSLAIR
jgi:hypothetical protein